MGSFQVAFLRPDGVVHTTMNISAGLIAANSSLCVNTQIPIGGTAAASYPGTWTIQVFWNQSNTPLFTLNFNITGPAVTLPLIQTVVSAEAYGGFTSIAPGTWIEIYGSNLGPSAGQTWASSNFNGSQAPTLTGSIPVSATNSS
jgi:hypothetical protein